jgi:hypothetical protein
MLIFYIQVWNKYIGIQIKPITYEQTPEIHKWKDWMKNMNKKFEQKFGGKVFVVFLIKKRRQKGNLQSRSNKPNKAKNRRIEKIGI